MNNGDDKVNQAIQCSVVSCAHHCGDKDYCSLRAIQVGCCDPSVAQSEQTQCASFDLGQRGTVGGK